MLGARVPAKLFEYNIYIYYICFLHTWGVGKKRFCKRERERDVQKGTGTSDTQCQVKPPNMFASWNLQVILATTWLWTKQNQWKMPKVLGKFLLAA